MKKFGIGRLLSIVLILVLVANIFAFIDADVAFASSSDYYKGITASGGNALLGQLHDLITTTHKNYTTYSDCSDPSIVKRTDPGTNGNVMEFYSQADISSSWGGGHQGTWNREHVWCQSLSNGLWGKNGGGSDLAHIRPAESGLNSARGNNKYGEVSNGSEAYYEDALNNPVALGGYISDRVFEPLDKVKGDVARIVMYVYTHYNHYSRVYGTTNGSGSASYFGELNFTHIISAGSEKNAIAMLLRWNKLDPVDDIERARNDVIQSIQGNRNPFVDNQNYADMIWGDSSTPVVLQGLEINPDEITLNIGQSRKLEVVTSPVDADSRVTWESSDSSIATVSTTGVVTALSEGDVIITATSIENTSINALALVTVSKSSSGNTESEFVTITQSSFMLTTGYGFKTWSSGGIGGMAFIYGGSSAYPPTGMQFNCTQSSYYLASNIATPGAIKSVTANIVSGKTARPWKLLTSNTPYTEVAGKPSNGTDHGTQTVTETGVTWNVDGNDTYFALCYEQTGSGACFLESITIEYSNGTVIEQPEPNPTELVCTPAELTIKESEANIELIKDLLSVELIYDNDTREEVLDYTIEGFDPTVFEKQTLTISHSGLTTTVKVTVEQSDLPEPIVQKIQVNPTMVELKIGATETQLRSKLAVEAVYDDGTTKTITDYTIEGFDSSKSGEQSITIKHGDFTATAKITFVEENVLSKNAQAFVDATEEIANASGTRQRFDKINLAIQAYKKLSVAEKDTIDVQEAYESLESAISEYNSAVQTANQNSKTATENATKGVVKVLSILGAIVYLIKHLL